MEKHKKILIWVIVTFFCQMGLIWWLIDEIIFIQIIATLLSLELLLLSVVVYLKEEIKQLKYILEGK